MSTLTSIIKAQSAGLPAPQLMLHRTNGAPDLVVAKDMPSGSSINVDAVMRVRVGSVGVPASILSNPALKPKLELLRYVRRSTSPRSTTGNTNQKGGYVHPSTNGNTGGNFTHGGIQHADPSIAVHRITEWDLTNHNQFFDVTQSMLAYMYHGSVLALDVNGNGNITKAVMPAGNFNKNTRFGKRFGYGGNLSPAYFKFRFSVVDLSDPRGKRITGPLSDVVSCANKVFPFVPTAPFNGRQTVAISPNYKDSIVSFWIGSVSRLPSG